LDLRLRDGMNASLVGALRRLGVGLALSSVSLSLWAQDQVLLPLPKPRTEGGKPLMQAFKERKSTREFSPRPLSEQQLSDLLWAAFGVNRPDGHRTAPSTMNLRCTDLYLATADGLFLFDADAHALKLLLKDDLRSATTGQAELRVAPVALIFVADHARMAKVAPGEREFYAAADTGYISQNVYLFCASEGLATVVHAVDRLALAKTMKLGDDKKVILAQTVGYPKP
jgi:nitroreductase